ncbi:DUF6973 domain-containing protein [Corynebacterium mastitidis]|uniref:DUF6973 domain-containing protein n=1 Tax=Corynebacterium mastitidis TaxID=161890 RepID=UPI003CC7FD96
MGSVGQGDAFRHCCWSGIMKLDIGEEVSAYTGVSHEVLGVPNGPADCVIALHDNLEGLEVVNETNGDKGQVKNICRD